MKRSGKTKSITLDVAIIGAGPYGLAAAAHLRTKTGLEIHTFGEPMSFWDKNMPAGMLLRSNWTATQIAHPVDLTLERYQAESGQHFSTPVPLENFVQYGLWYQRQSVPDLDQRKVLRVEPDSNGFRLRLSDGDMMVSRRVVIAAGIGSFAFYPPEFLGMPSPLVSHASMHRDLSSFRGRRVLVVGGGQSALESGALLHESGADVEIVSRRSRIQWLQGFASKTLHHRMGKFTRRFLYAPTDVGPAGLSQLLARPDLVRKLPRGLQDKLRKRAIRPAGARWLVKRLEGVRLQLECPVASATAAGDHIRVKLGNGGERTVDHVLLGTGYRIDIAKYDFLSEELLKSIDRFNGFPVLKPGLETSVPGLYILGAPAAWSFGPLMQFVSGTTYACRALLDSIAGMPVRERHGAYGRHNNLFDVAEKLN